MKIFIQVSIMLSMIGILMLFSGCTPEIKSDDGIPGPWTKLIGVASKRTAVSTICTDKNDNIYAAGVTAGNLDGQIVTGSTDMFLVKYGSNGAKLWTRLLGTASSDTFAVGICIDSNNNAYITGYTNGNLDGQTITGTKDLFIARYDSNGVRQWTKLLGVALSETESMGACVDLNDNIYVIGYTNGNLDGQTRTGTTDLFIVKYDTSGIRQWTRLQGVAGAGTAGYGICFDPAGFVYGTGNTSGNLGGQILAGFHDAYIVKYDTGGAIQWTRLFGFTSCETYGYGICRDSTGNIYITGHSNKTVGYNLDMIIVKYDSAGVKKWATGLDAFPGFTSGRSICIDTNDNIYAAGGTEGNLNGQLVTGTTDMLVSKFNTDGMNQWTRLLGVPASVTMAFAVFSDSNGGNIYAGGQTVGNLDGQAKNGIIDGFIVKYKSNGVKQ